MNYIFKYKKGKNEVDFREKLLFSDKSNSMVMPLGNNGITRFKGVNLRGAIFH